MSETKHKQVMAFIAVVRGSFHDSAIVYRYGGCFGLYQILRHIFPEAEAYFSDEKYDHILTKIGPRYYEIKGEEHVRAKSPPVKLSKLDHEHWEVVSNGQRLELMLNKYREANEK